MFDVFSKKINDSLSFFWWSKAISHRIINNFWWWLEVENRKQQSVYPRIPACLRFNYIVKWGNSDSSQKTKLIIVKLGAWKIGYGPLFLELCKIRSKQSSQEISELEHRTPSVPGRQMPEGHNLTSLCAEKNSSCWGELKHQKWRKFVTEKFQLEIQ